MTVTAAAGKLSSWEEKAEGRKVRRSEGQRVGRSEGRKVRGSEERTRETEG